MAAPFRAKRLDLGAFVNARVIRDHTKRKVVEQFEPERCAYETPLMGAIEPLQNSRMESIANDTIEL